MRDSCSVLLHGSGLRVSEQVLQPNDSLPCCHAAAQPIMPPASCLPHYAHPLTPGVPAVAAAPVPSSGGDGGGSAAGIAAGVAGGCVAAVALIIGAWWWRRRAHRRRTLAALEEGKGVEPPPGERGTFVLVGR